MYVTEYIEDHHAHLAQSHISLRLPSWPRNYYILNITYSNSLAIVSTVTCRHSANSVGLGQSTSHRWLSNLPPQLTLIGFRRRQETREHCLVIAEIEPSTCCLQVLRVIKPLRDVFLATAGGASREQIVLGILVLNEEHVAVVERLPRAVGIALLIHLS